MISFSSMGSLGRLGNQMFQYACTYAVARKNLTSPSISTHDSHTGNQRNQLVETFRLSSATYNSYSGITRQFREKDFNYDSKIENVTIGTDLFGYFQSEKYFRHYRTDLLDSEFVFNANIQANSRSHIVNLGLSGPMCSIHIRMGDYRNLGDTHVNLGIDYYANALSLVPDCDSYLVFSDEYVEAKKMLRQLDFEKAHRLVYLDLDFATTMHMMSMCDHHVIANSSFSWWGAWLSKNSQTTIAPSAWFGPRGPKSWNDVYCEGWRKI